MNLPTNDKLRIKDTRWDRIRKKHINNIHVKTETVKKLIKMDFIDKKQMKLLNGELENRISLDPTIIMELRHKMFVKKPKPKPTIDEKKISLENVKNHNRLVEDKYIEHELTKFKTELKQKRPKQTIITKPKLCLDLTNKTLMNSLENCENHIKDFYTTSCDAIKEVIRASETPSFQNHTANDEIENPPNDEKTKVHEIPQNDKCVRFGDSIEIINYSRTDSMCSNTSDDIESVKSETVDESVAEVENKNVTVSEQKSTEKSKAERANTKARKQMPVTLVDEDVLKITQIQYEKPNNTTKQQQKNDEDSDSESVTAETTDTNDEQNKILAELFKPRFPPRELLLRKYFLKWIHFTTLEKLEKHNYINKTDRIQKINAFLDNIRREKARILTNKPNACTMNKDNRQNMAILTKKYQNKIKIQQDIIELQKLKLERQERMIMALKLSKLTEEGKKAREDIKNELKTVIRNGDFKNRAKAKSLQLVGNLRDEEDEEFERLQGKSLMTPKFLARMHERALERSIKHEQARQRRLQLEAEREAAKAAAEEAKRLEDEEAKKKRIEALKEKRRQEKMAKILKERERQKCIENNRKAQECCRRRILRRIGMEGFKRILQMRKSNQRKAILHRRRILKLKIFIAWKQYHNEIWQNKYRLADKLYIKIIKRTIFRSWVLYISIQHSKYLVAVDWYELKLSEYVFQRWYGLTKLEKVIEEAKTKQAYSHYQWHLKWKVIDRWTRLPQILKLERETEERRQRWRMKIWELIPDYVPNRDDNF